MKITSRCIRLMLLLAVALAGSLTTSAQRNINVNVNKHNFVRQDTLRVNAEFKGFESDPIIDEVYIDLLDTETDSVVGSALMTRTSDNKFYGELCLPGNGFENHSDILKLSKMMSINNDYIYANGVEAGIWCDVKLKYGEPTYRVFQQLPMSDITFIGFHPRYINREKSNDRAKDFILTVRTSKTYPLNDNFIVQVTGVTKSGEIVAGVENIKIHKIHYKPYFEDKDLLRSEENYLVKQSMTDKWKWWK